MADQSINLKINDWTANELSRFVRKEILRNQEEIPATLPHDKTKDVELGSEISTAASTSIRWKRESDGAMLGQIRGYGTASGGANGDGAIIEASATAQASTGQSSVLLSALRSDSASIQAYLWAVRRGSTWGTGRNAVAFLARNDADTSAKSGELNGEVGLSDLSQFDDAPWAGLTFGANWADLDASHLCQYRKDIHGEIHLRGVLYPTAGYGYPTTMAYLPAGACPAQEMHMVALRINAGAFELGVIQITTGGIISAIGTVAGRPDAGAVGNVWYLSNISFMSN